jgi:hypothetical protein
MIAPTLQEVNNVSQQLIEALTWISVSERTYLGLMHYFHEAWEAWPPQPKVESLVIGEHTVHV